MTLYKLAAFSISLFLTSITYSQSGEIHGQVFIEDSPLAYASVEIESLGIMSYTNNQGEFHIHNVALGSYVVRASFVGSGTLEKNIVLSNENDHPTLNFQLEEQDVNLEEIVVTGTKTHKRKTNSPVIVNVITSKTLDNIQACNLSEGLKFQPGLRVETDCQTCNYTQLRMNGLAGGYSQILINGRPIFSPLTGLYGMEQLPTNMIDRIEIIRGGGSSLYGSSAIGGTVNVITKTPKSDSYEVDFNYQNINAQTNDFQLRGNASVVAENYNSGATVFINRRERGFYDHNGDNYSEIPMIKNSSVGMNLFFLPSSSQKLELSLSHMNEYRFGGEMNTSIPVHLTQQSEERTHDVLVGNLDYQWNSKNNRTSIIAYGAWQNTARKHYTGIIPEDSLALQNHLENPPYGTSLVNTLNTGVQVNYKFPKFISGENIFTLGSEYLYDDVEDEIPAYSYLIDQTTSDMGTFIQSDWNIKPKLNLLSGARMDIHNLVSNPVFSPRAALLYKPQKNLQFRLNYGTGFRAPQAFDADLHIAFAGGGISRVLLSPDLAPENSRSYSGSINYDKPLKKMIFGFTLETFYTELEDAFYLEPIGTDAFGELFEKRNGEGALVKGMTAELRANFDKKLQFESGFTVQSSEFQEDVEYIEGLPRLKKFTRTPENYGFATLTWNPSKRFTGNLNYVYTGSMVMPHFGGADNQTEDVLFTSDAFSELSGKVAYQFILKSMGSRIEIYSGVKNLFNSYQREFDIGKNRDSNFVYGPSQPRTIFFGVKLSSL